MKRIIAFVNNGEYDQIEGYCKKKRISIYQLVKSAVFERVGIEYRRKKLNAGGR